MPDDLYQLDILAWSDAQASRLRRLAAGERVNDLDWDNVIEEIESVGRSEAQAVQSFLLQAWLHGMKVAAWPEHAAVRKWRNEIDAFLLSARRRYSPSMGQRIDLAEIHRDAHRLFCRLGISRPARAVAAATDLALPMVMAEEFDADALIAWLSPPA